MNILNLFRRKPKPEAKEPSEPICPVCRNDKLLDVTSYGDKERKLLCGECGWHSDRAKTSS